MLKLYGYFRSSAAFRVRIALNLKRLAYDQAFVHLRKNEQRAPAYLAKNPQGLVPLLEDGDAHFVQSLAIIEYLDEIHPAPKFLPEGPEDRARVRALAQIVAADIHPLDNLRVLRYLAKPLGHDEKTVEAWFNHWIRLGFEAIEPMLRDRRTGDFCHGNAPGLADICLVPQMFNAKRYPSFDLTPFPTIVRVFGNCMQLDAFKRAAPDQQPDFEK
ncbi:MAG: maleylacetoacetate isomerase [Alphaproteobacteria bacterium]|nr:maleylacetoacetate isomerase [Alphaproteobacteria bacterium]